ncbi:subtilisin-like protease SBT3.9 [Lycium barbarum]|uniref:subtilisin-like protease SBT3.9 n=1 Tax=Lycium barbarum TaxID=112863 RepID=UPI00293E7113|nr:subtilisin-like protease SBT3.9 [Lycium barbarum]
MARGKHLSSTTFLFLVLISHFSVIIASIDELAPKDKKIYIVYTKNSDYVKILASVLGSEEAATEAIVYTYRYAVEGFSASLTPEQASRLSGQDDVLSVQESKLYRLDKGFEGQTNNQLGELSNDQ